MPDYSFASMSAPAALRIADGWRYEAPYDFFNPAANAQTYEDFTNPERWPGVFQQAKIGGLVAGFFRSELAETADGSGISADISLGLHPDLTDQGTGAGFLTACLLRLRELHPEVTTVTAEIPEFNTRALRVFEDCGFDVIGRQKQISGGAKLQILLLSGHFAG
ncbi:MAG: GNAT family N-acetyltransferase [Ancrocorticia sp.]|uniref:GNAT family N-acetyltransferase n=1 Tax=Ancrocorticia sp. TaxID=2593684 RepID=UPI003F926BB0